MGIVSDRSKALRARRPIIIGALAVCASLAVLLVHAARYYPFIADDALISLRYAERFVQGAGLTWTDGERVEGYSNLLWVLLNAGLGALGLDLIFASRLLGVGCFAVVFVALVLAADDRHRIFGSPLIVGVLLALTGPVAVWSVGGLEQPLCAAWLALALLHCARLIRAERSRRHAHWAGVSLALLCWTRPDAPVLVAPLAFSCFFLLRSRGLRRALVEVGKLIAWPCAAVMLQLAFRLWYYGDLLPNTAYVKGEMSEQRVKEGFDYLVDGALPIVPLILLALVGVYAALRRPERRAMTLPALAALICWSAYVVTIGGDIFPAHRHFVINLVALAWLSLEGIGYLLGRRPIAGWLVAVGVAGTLLHLQLEEPANRTAILERWEWEGKVIGEMFREGFAAEHPYLAVTAAGTLPYFSKLPALDMQGLNDRHIAHRPSEAGFLGHDHGDGHYVLDRAPDLIAFRGPGRGPPAFVSGRHMQRDRRFRRDYQLVRFEGHEPFFAVSLSWVRRQGRIGHTRTEERVVVPAYLLNKVIGHLDSSGAMAGYVPERTTATSNVLELAPGAWRARLEPVNPLLSIELVNEGEHRLSSGGGCFESEHPLKVRVRVRSGSIATTLRSLIIERAASPSKGRTLEPGARRVLLRRSETKGGRTLRALHTDATSWPNRQGYVALNERGVTSFHEQERDKSTARLTSPPFNVPENAYLELALAGGGDRSKVGLRLRLAGRSRMTWAAADSQETELHRFDLGAYANRSVQLELFDDSEGAWGHIEWRGAWLKQLRDVPAAKR